MRRDARAEMDAEGRRLGILRDRLLEGLVAGIPDLRVNGQPASISVLERTRLVIRSTDHEGIESVTEVPDFPRDSGPKVCVQLVCVAKNPSSSRYTVAVPVP